LPAPQNFIWHTWWQFSTQFFTQFLAVMGFTTTSNLTHQQYYPLEKANTLFTIVAQKSAVQASRFPVTALWRSNMKKLLRQMIVGTFLEPLARKVQAAFARK
jgi:ketopantoate reductase